MHCFGLKQALTHRIKVLCVNLQIDKRNIVLLDGVLNMHDTAMTPFSLLSLLPKPDLSAMF